MQMADFGATDLYPTSAANNWYPTQFTSIGNTFTGLNSNLNLAGSSGHQLNSLNQIHHHSSSLESATNSVLHNSPPNSASPQQTHQQSSANNSHLTNLSNNVLPSVSQTTQSNHSTQQLLSPIQTAAQTHQSRSNTTSLNLSTSSNSTSTNGSNNALPTYSPQLGSYPTHQFNLQSTSQFNPHSLSSHHSHQHTLNHFTAHHPFLNNNFFPVHHTANVVSGPPSSFNTPPSPSSPNNTSINSTTNAFNSLTFRPDSTSSNPAGTMNAVAAMAAMSRAGLSPSESTASHQFNGASYDRMHAPYSFPENSSLARGYPSLIDHHSSRTTSGLDTFVNLRHMPTLTNLTSNCNTGNGSLMNNLDDTNVNSMFIAHHNQSLMAAGLNHHSTGNAGNQVGNSAVASLVPLHGSTHNNSLNSNSDSRHNVEEELTINCIKQEDEDEKANITNHFPNSSLDHHHPIAYNWTKRSAHTSQQPQAGNKRKTRTRDKYRVVYTDNQRIELEKEFLYSRYITIRKKSELAQALNLSERQVKIWFQNRRAKSRKLDKKKENESDFKQNPLTINHH